MPARSQSGGRLPRKATPTPHSTSARPIGSAAASRPTSAPRRPGSSARRNKGHVDAQTTLGLLLFQNGNQAAGLKWLKRRRSKASRARCWSTAPPCSTATASRRTRSRLRLCQPRRRTGPGAGQGNAGAARQVAAGRRPQEGRRDRHRRRPKRRRRRAPKAVSRAEAQAGADAAQRRAAKRSDGALRAVPRTAPAAAGAAIGESSSALSRNAARPKRCIKRSPGTARWRGASRSMWPRVQLFACRSGHSPVARRRSRRATRSRAPASRSPGEIISCGTSRGGARPGPTAKRRGRDA